MEQSEIFDRHRLRRKLRFWRITTIIVAVLIFAIALFSQNQDLITQDHIARVEISGVIQDDDELISRLEAIEEDDQAKALIITISSPGGTTFGGERIYKAIKKISDSKPVVADVRTLAASAGYMIAAGSNYIVAGETSIVGSIGVIFQYPQLSELMKKIGISYEEIKSSPLKAEPSPFHPASPEAVAMINSMIMDSYDWFVDIVTERRSLSKAQALKLADGSIFTGRQALQNGLIDSTGGAEEIRAYLTSKDIDEALEIIDRRAPGTPTSSFFANSLQGIIQQLLGVDANNTQKWLGDHKLFLDGMLSFWQFGHNSAEN